MNISQNKETVLRGIPLSTGMAIARVCRFNEHRHSNLDIYKVQGAGPEKETRRFERAVKVTLDRLDTVREQALKRVGARDAEIFTVQSVILQDEALLSRIREIIKTQETSAEAAVAVIFDAFEDRLRKAETEHIRERSADYSEVKRRILDVLSNINPEFQCASREYCQRGTDRIIVASELTPRLTMEIDHEHTLGFVTEHGGVNSHAAILARALGIPAVSGIENIHKEIDCGTEIMLDGDSGTVVVRPNEDTIRSKRDSAGINLRLPDAVDPIPSFTVMANISLASEAVEALEMKADGIGLYRTEFEFMMEGRLLSENEQYERYAAVIKAMEGRPVCFRLFDAGGDKRLPFLDITDEHNPALGLRGARLLLSESALLKTQARALGMAARHGPVHVIYPMIVDVEQFIELRQLVDSALDGLNTDEIKHGVMFEIPSACLQADTILNEADFGSVGTNDLIQYLFAVDRDNERVAIDYSPDRQALWDMMTNLAAAARRAGKPLSVCGELAGEPKYIPRLMKAGIKEISVSSRLIPAIRRAVMSYQLR